MALYTITLTSVGANSGPYYTVTWATSSININNPVDSGSPAYLPTVGSTANVTVTGTFSTIYFNLNNNVSSCSLCDTDVTASIIATPTPTPTPTPTSTPTPTPTPTVPPPTDTPTPTPTGAPTFTPTPTPTETPVPPTDTPTPTPVPPTPTPTPTAVPPTDTPTPTPTPTSYVFYEATQFLDCQQNSSPGEYILRVPTSLDSGTWWCGDDGLQYQFHATISPDPPSFDVTAVSNASPSSCQNLSC